MLLVLANFNTFVVLPINFTNQSYVHVCLWSVCNGV